MPRIYTSQNCSINSTLCLDARTSHYLTRVLRCKVKDALDIFNGDGYAYQAHISQLTKTQVHVFIQNVSEQEQRSPLNMHLGICISKGERMDTIMQKCTELGVQAITPLLSEHQAFKLKPELQEKKWSHWQQIIISACEQSQQNYLPDLFPITTLENWLGSTTSDLKLCLHPNANIGLHHVATQHPRSLLFLIGAEGGLSATEIQLAEQHHFTSVNLGPRILRTETAPLAMAAIAQYLWGDF